MTDDTNDSLMLPAPLTALLTGNFDARISAVEEAGHLPRSLGRALARIGLNDSEDLIRSLAAELLGDVGNASDVGALELALLDPSWEVRSAAVTALGELQAKRSFKVLLYAMQSDPHWAVRRDAAHALAGYGARANKPLNEALKSETEPGAITGLLWAIYVTGTDSALASYLDFLRHEDRIIRSNAINGIDAAQIRPRHREGVIAALTLAANAESNPGNRGDALAQIGELESF